MNLENMDAKTMAEFESAYATWFTLERDRRRREGERYLESTPKTMIFFYTNVWNKTKDECPTDTQDENFLVWKEMVYELSNEAEIIGHGFYQNREWVISNCGGAHPTAYVKLTKDESKRLNGFDYFYDIDVHGGCTWLDTFVPVFQNTNDDCKWFGWDYAHGGDYDTLIARSCEKCGYFDNGKQYTTGDVYKDVKSVIKQLNEFDWDNFRED